MDWQADFRVMQGVVSFKTLIFIFFTGRKIKHNKRDKNEMVAKDLIPVHATRIGQR